MKFKWPMEHGGKKIKRRKEARPLDLDRPILLVFRSSKAVGSWSLLQPVHQKLIRYLMGFYAARFSVQIIKTANFGHQFQMVVKARSRVSLQNFLRGFAGTLAMRITGAKKGVRTGRFWSFLAYSRVLATANELRSVLSTQMLKARDFSRENVAFDLFGMRVKKRLNL